MEPEYITLVEAAELAGVAPAELRRYANELLPDGTQRLRTVLDLAIQELQTRLEEAKKQPIPF